MAELSPNFHQMHVFMSFLNDDLKADNNMEHHEGSAHSSKLTHFFKIPRAMHGLEQASVE